jgi:beta-galactosidase
MSTGHQLRQARSRRARLLRFTLCSALALIIAGLVSPCSYAAGARLPRERVSLNDGWRFHRGDPVGTDAAVLLYDVRPDITDARDDKAADSKPELAAAVSTGTRPVLKPWILPTGNRFLKDPQRRHARPDGDPGGDVPCVQAGYDDRAWTRVDLPHDWAIAGPFFTGSTGVGGGMGRLPSPGIGWYRKTLTIPASDKGRLLFLDIDGAMSYATVWVNGHLAGGWPYGYASWRVDLTPYLTFGGRNQIAIRLDNPAESARWYPGGGLYRNVWLVKTQPVHVAQWGTVVTTPHVSRETAAVTVSVTVDNDGRADDTVRVQTEVFPLGTNGNAALKPVASVSPAELMLRPGTNATLTGTTRIDAPQLWGPRPTQEPHLYVAVTTLRRGAVIVDRYETRFGIRDVRFDPARGVIVNGERLRIQGVNQHHDLGSLGAAFNLRAAERQLELLRQAGVNAIRTSHNPPAPELLELTDSMGFLVLDEIFDSWYLKKTPLDFHLIFPDWHEQDLRAMVRRDRNHPSVIIWSAGNEVGEQYTGQDGAAVSRRLRDIVHDEDRSRPVTSAMNYAMADMPMPGTLDLIALNYQGEGIRDLPEFEGTDRIRKPPQYPSFHKAYPDKVIVSAESASALSTRGTFLFPVAPGNFSIVRDNGRGGDSSKGVVSDYGLYAVDFGASPDKVFAAQDANPYVAGEFVWTGWDHLGEPTPYYTARSAYCGFIDLAGFPKERFYLYQSRWRPDLPMAHILPHWTWPERAGEVTPVHVFTSGDEAELFLNGQSLGRKKKGPGEYRLRWDDVKYQPGELKVVAYKDGKSWATDTVKTAGAASTLAAAVDRPVINADGIDLAFVTVRVNDAAGVMAPRADNRVRFTVDGPGELVATDNGDPTSFESFQSPDRAAFNGLVLAVVRAKPGRPGTIRVTATGPGLKDATVTIRAAATVGPPKSLRE